MNPSKLSHTFRAQESYVFPCLSTNQSIMLIKQPMIETPEKDRRFDPNELMNIGFVKTPLDTKCLASSISTSDPSAPSMIEKLSLRNRMVCHEDLPRLLALLNQVRREKESAKKIMKQSIKEESESAAKLMKEQYESNNFTIYRGQCSLTDCKMQDYYSMLQYHLKSKTTATIDDHDKFNSTAPARLFERQTQHNSGHLSATKQHIQSKNMTTADLISWAEDFLKTSPKIDSNTPARGKKFVKRKSPFQKKTINDKKTKGPEKKNSKKQRRKTCFMDNCAEYNVADTKTTIEKKRCVGKFFDSLVIQSKKPISSSLKLGQNSPTNRSLVKPNLKLPNPTSSLHSPTQTIASDIAIALTPHPFKTPKPAFVPSEVTAKYNEPLSDITSRSTRSSTVFDQRNFLTAKENHDGSMEKPFLKTIDEAYTLTRGNICDGGVDGIIPFEENSDTVKKCIEKDPEFSKINSPHILSVSFS